MTEKTDQEKPSFTLELIQDDVLFLLDFLKFQKEKQSKGIYTTSISALVRNREKGYLLLARLGAGNHSIEWEIQPIQEPNLKDLLNENPLDVTDLLKQLQKEKRASEENPGDSETEKD